MRRSALRRISDRRLVETDLYRYRIKQFLLEHPYCQVWLAEQDVPEEVAIHTGGRVLFDGPSGPVTFIPLSTQVHHKNKRRGAHLLDQSQWLAVSAAAHDRIESNKAWARAQGFLLNF